jgi:hypothetical protein
MRREEYIRRALDQQHAELVAIRSALSQIQVQLAMLKVKAGVWGALAGAVPAIAAVLYYLVK